MPNSHSKYPQEIEPIDSFSKEINLEEVMNFQKKYGSNAIHFTHENPYFFNIYEIIRFGGKTKNLANGSKLISPHRAIFDATRQFWDNIFEPDI